MSGTEEGNNGLLGIKKLVDKYLFMHVMVLKPIHPIFVATRMFNNKITQRKRFWGQKTLKIRFTVC